MEYNYIEKWGMKVPRLGFGCMRLPTLFNGKIDNIKFQRMVDIAMSNGVNYFDTGYFYHEGQSELLLARMLKKYPRNNYYLATKMPITDITTLEEAMDIFETQLGKLNTKYIDFYLLHGLNRNTFVKAKNLGVIDYLLEQQDKGRIKLFGFSFHDTYSVFKEIIEYRDWDFCQIQFNYYDINEQAGLRGYKLCVEKNIPIIVMEPVRGGHLAKLPRDLSDMLCQYNPNQSDAAWALKWVKEFNNCKIILSGMSDIDQMLDNINTFNSTEKLSQQEMDLLYIIGTKLRQRLYVHCTGCKYCQPCPKNIDIPNIFAAINDYTVFNDKRPLRNMNVNISQCIECKRCESHCPQFIDIVKKIKQYNWVL